MSTIYGLDGKIDGADKVMIPSRTLVNNYYDGPLNKINPMTTMCPKKIHVCACTLRYSPQLTITTTHRGSGEFAGHIEVLPVQSARGVLFDIVSKGVGVVVVEEGIDIQLLCYPYQRSGYVARKQRAAASIISVYRGVM